MAKLIGVLLVAFAVLAVGPPTPQKTLLVYGDSLAYESAHYIGVGLRGSGWREVSKAVPFTAPCDWLPRVAADIAKYRPVVIAVATAGNSNTRCMNDPATGRPWPYGSAGYFARYDSDLESIYSLAAAAGARVLFVDAPHFLEAVRETAVNRLIATATTEAKRNPTIVTTSAVRDALTVDGRYAASMPCLPDEGRSEGCVNGSIPVRTISGFQIGLHLCPPGLTNSRCPVYSSGERRFGAALARAALSVPKAEGRPQNFVSARAGSGGMLIREYETLWKMFSKNLATPRWP